MQLSVIILNYNVRYFLEHCIISVQQALTNIDSEIIIVDNNSSDDSCEMMRANFPDIQLIANDENTGFPKGNNIGVAAAKGEYICILNPDTVVAEDTFEKVLAFAEKAKNPGIIGVRLIDGTGKFLPESKRGVPTPFVAFTKITGIYKYLPRFYGGYYARHLRQHQSGRVSILVGAFMLMKRKLYNDLGGFDENCFMYSDDIDLSYRVLKSGRSNYYFAGTTVIHYKGESTIRDESYMNRFREAMEYFYNKHYGGSKLFEFAMTKGASYFAKSKKDYPAIVKRPVLQYVVLSDNDLLQDYIYNELCGYVFDLKGNEINSLISYGMLDDTIIVFDGNSCSYQSIIFTMHRIARPGLMMRIIPRGRQYLIGSDSSNDRGEVYQFEANDKTA